MEKINLSEFKSELEKMNWVDIEDYLCLAEELLSDSFNKETDEKFKLELAKAIYSIRKSEPKDK